jgi:cell wall assembly regulator SMI1
MVEGVMASERPPPDHASLLDSFRRLTGWMRENRVSLLADNLAPGAKPAQLVKLQGKLGFKVSPGLRALWLLHDGQRKALNGFVGPLQLLPIAWVLNERVHTLKLVARVRAEPRLAKAADLKPEELASDAWLPIAARDEVSLVVHCGTGRVFAGELTDDEAPLRLVADSVPQWLAAYADSVEAGEFEARPGLGDYHLWPLEEPADEGEDEDEGEDDDADDAPPDP